MAMGGGRAAAATLPLLRCAAEGASAGLFQLFTAHDGNGHSVRLMGKHIYSPRVKPASRLAHRPGQFWRCSWCLRLARQPEPRSDNAGCAAARRAASARRCLQRLGACQPLARCGKEDKMMRERR